MWITVILFVAGIALIVSEFVVPGAILGVLGGLLLIASTAYGWYTFPQYGVFIALAELAGLGASILVGMYLMANTRVSAFMTQRGEMSAEAGYLAPMEDPALIGQEGEAFTYLRPAGWIMVAGRRVDAVSEGHFIEKGTRVRVIDVEGHRVVVEPLESVSVAHET